MHRQKPIILITSFNDDPKDKDRLVYNAVAEMHVEHIIHCGGLPLIVPPNTDPKDLKQLEDIADGLLLQGGEDVHPKHYGNTELHPKTDPDLSGRDEVEIALVKIFAETKKPIFGICRGMQVVNVALGGTLIQDIESEIKTEIIHEHREERVPLLARYKEEAHRVNSTLGSALEKILNKQSLLVNSLHHQAVRDIAPTLQVCGLAEGDGVIEAIESKNMEDRWILGVQWHPETLFDSHPEEELLYRAFVNAAQKRRGM